MSQLKLNQAVALSTGKKNESKNDLTKLYQSLNNADLFKGLTKTYSPLDEDGEAFPPESKLLQLRVQNLLTEVASISGDLFDVVATQEFGNTKAKANVEVDGKVVLKDVPVPYLLFLEKQLGDLLTVFSKLPVNDPVQEWTYDKDNGFYRAREVKTAKTKKIPRVLTKAEATDKHPAQVEVYYEDVVTGYWTKTDLSGALSLKERCELVNKTRALRDAVIKARELANSTEVDKQSVGANIFGYLFG